MGVATSPRELLARAWCDGSSLGAGGSQGDGEVETGLSLEDCAVPERSESRGLPFLLESLHLRWEGEILQAEAGLVLPELSCDLAQPSSVSCTLISCSGTRSSPETRQQSGLISDENKNITSCYVVKSDHYRRNKSLV